MLSDIFGQPVNEGDFIAVGMAFGRSSVLRVGRVVKIANAKDSYSSQVNYSKWSITVEWTHNGDKTPGRRYGHVEKSTIKFEDSFTFAKFMVLPPNFVAQFPPDIVDVP